MLHALRRHILTSKAARILSTSKKTVIFTGAGISASAGIPTFRDVGGLWTTEEVAFFGSPEAWYTDPWRCWNAYESFRVSSDGKSPTPSHWAVSILEDTLKEVKTFTSNVDSLHLASGSRAKEIHGCLRQARCMMCMTPVSLPKGSVLKNSACPSCGNWLRHDVVLWGEEVRHTEELEEALNQADVLLLIGASGDVTDIERMAEKMMRRGKNVIEINPNPTTATPYSSLSFRENSDVILPSLVQKLDVLNNKDYLSTP
jgi:NAD-dependent deacetylase